MYFLCLSVAGRNADKEKQGSEQRARHTGAYLTADCPCHEKGHEKGTRVHSAGPGLVTHVPGVSEQRLLEGQAAHCPMCLALWMLAGSEEGQQPSGEGLYCMNADPLNMHELGALTSPIMHCHC